MNRRRALMAAQGVKKVNGWFYPFNGSLLSDGTEEFGFVGQGVYADGLFNRKCYSHIIPTSGDATSDTQMGLKAVGLTKFPNLSGDFTISYWCATQAQGVNHPLYLVKYVNGGGGTGLVSNVTYKSTWTGSIASNGNAFSGIGVQGSSSGNGKILLRLTNSAVTKGGRIDLTIPSGFDTTQWHHYAITKKDTTLRYFVDGTLMYTATLADGAIYEADQVCVSAVFYSDGTNIEEIMKIANGCKMQDLYIAELCKWESDFDPTSIQY